MSKYKLESNQKFEKIKDKVIEIKQKQEETKKIHDKPIESEEQMNINTDKIRALKNKRFVKKEIKQEELW